MSVFDSFSIHPYYEGMNNESYLNDLFRRVETKVRRLLRLQRKQTMPNRFDLSDVVQEVNAQLWETAQENGDIAHFLDTAWLDRVTTGHFCKLQRLNLAQKRSVSREVEHDLDSLGYDEQKRLEMDKDLSLMLDCLDQIEPDTRHAIIRRCHDGASFRQISDELSTSEYGVKTLVAMGLERLQQIMEGSPVK